MSTDWNIPLSRRTFIYVYHDGENILPAFYFFYKRLPIFSFFCVSSNFTNNSSGCSSFSSIFAIFRSMSLPTCFRIFYLPSTLPSRGLTHGIKISIWRSSNPLPYVQPLSHLLLLWIYMVLPMIFSSSYRPKPVLLLESPPYPWMNLGLSHRIDGEFETRSFSLFVLFLLPVSLL